MDGQLAIHAFGDLHLTLDGHESGFASRREAALTFYLVYAGQVCARSSLAELIWPASKPMQARTNLRRALSNLRHYLPGLLVISRGYVQVDPDRPVWVDVHEFEACVSRFEPPDVELLEKAIELYRGDFLAHFSIDSQPFQEWVLLEQERLRLLAIEALDTLVRQCEAVGDYLAGLKYASRLCQMDDLREPSQRHLMRLHYHAGNRGAALAQYEAYCRLLQAQLGVRPETETQALYEKIQGDGRLASVADRPVPIGHPLPARRRAFIGRRAEVEMLVQQLTTDPHCRMLTLTGIGGIGKTRLALEIAHQVTSAFDNGVFWVDLTPIQTLDAGLNALASALGLQFRPGTGSPEDQLAAHLQDKQALVVLDNYEHLIAALTPFVEKLLHEAPDIRLLITSRQPLSVAWEWLHQVEGLVFPHDWREEDAAAFDAVQLFINRARRVRQSFDVEDHLECVVHICQQVGGMPLGIELAAGWLRVMPCAEIARELAHLKNPAQDIPARHRSLGALLEDTWQRLSPGEQDLLSHLSVFKGGFDREAAQAVAGASLPMLAALVNRSLLQVDHHSWRFSIHLVLKDFAEARLAEDDLSPNQVRFKHCAYYARWLHELEPALQGDDCTAALDSIEIEIDNLRAAWNRAVAEAWLDPIASALEGLATFYAFRNWNKEATQMFRAADLMLKGRPETPDLVQLRLQVTLKLMARVMAVEGFSTVEIGEICHQAWQLCRRVEQTPGLIQTLYTLGTFYGTRGDYATELELAAYGLDVAEQYAAEAEDQGLLLLIHDSYAFSYLFMGRFEECLLHASFMVEHYDPVRHSAISRIAGLDVGVLGLVRMAWALYLLGFSDRGLHRAEQALVLAESLQSALSTAFVYAFLVPILYQRGEWEASEVLSQAYVDLCQTQHLYLFGSALAIRGVWINHAGDVDEAIATLKRGIAAWRGIGSECATPYYLGWLADVLWQAGQLEVSEEVVREALNGIERTGERMAEAELRRIKGGLLWARGDEAAAEHALQQAIAVAQDQRARTWELRATTSLARLWQQQGRTTEAQSRLQAIYDWFTEGFDTADLRRARALLDELGAS